MSQGITMYMYYHPASAVPALRCQANKANMPSLIDCGWSWPITDRAWINQAFYAAIERPLSSAAFQITQALIFVL